MSIDRRQDGTVPRKMAAGQRHCQGGIRWHSNITQSQVSAAQCQGSTLSQVETRGRIAMSKRNQGPERVHGQRKGCGGGSDRRRQGLVGLQGEKTKEMKAEATKCQGSLCSVGMMVKLGFMRMSIGMYGGSSSFQATGKAPGSRCLWKF
jgi:hypothetical protein